MGRGNIGRNPSPSGIGLYRRNGHTPSPVLALALADIRRIAWLPRCHNRWVLIDNQRAGRRRPDNNPPALPSLISKYIPDNNRPGQTYVQFHGPLNFQDLVNGPSLLDSSNQLLL